MESTIRLFRALPIKSYSPGNLDEEVTKETIKKGFIFSPNIFNSYSKTELLKLNIGISGEEINSSFHKSWQKIKTASLEQLVTEQIIHYFTTYGLENMGIYNKDFVYIPSEELKIPDVVKEEIKLTIIKGYTKEELKNKLLELLKSGLALKDTTLKDVIDIALFVGIEEKEAS